MAYEKQFKQNGDAQMEENFFNSHDAAERWKQAAEIGAQVCEARQQVKLSKNQKKLLRQQSEVKVDPDILSFLYSTALNATPDSESALMALADNPDVYQTASLEQHTKAYGLLLTLLPSGLLENIRANLCHEYVSRASHNAFSIRPTADGDHSGEFLGYGVWPEASFFNHSCRPNLRKSREGRQWSFWTASDTDIEEGDELCITYLGGEERDLTISQRRDKLKEEWGFWCRCQRCIQEEGNC